MLETTNSTSGYEIIVQDDADLLTDNEESSLASQYMEDVSEYGNVAFLSTDSNPYNSTSSYAEHYCNDTFGNSNSVVFVIDMDYHYLYIYSSNDIADEITTSYANTITDNVYSYASDGDYYNCASEAYTEIQKVLAGQHVNQPMKYASNAILAILVALLINYFIVKNYSRGKKATSSQLINGINYSFQLQGTRTYKVNTKRIFSPLPKQNPNHGGGPGGGHGGGGGGFSGGGSGHGAGGGHRF